MRARLNKDWNGQSIEYGWQKSLKKGDLVEIIRPTFQCDFTMDVRPIQFRNPPYTISVPNEILDL